jgi:hypothetical protein
MSGWLESGAHLSSRCPVCRGPLRTQPLPLSQRLAVAMRTEEHWQRLPARLLLLLSSLGIAAAGLVAVVGVNTLNKEWRPGYRHGLRVRAGLS